MHDRVRLKSAQSWSIWACLHLFAAAADRLGLPEREATSIALAWFDARHWVNLMITVMARREFRDAAGAALTPKRPGWPALHQRQPDRCAGQLCSQKATVKVGRR